MKKDVVVRMRIGQDVEDALTRLADQPDGSARLAKAFADALGAEAGPPPAHEPNYLDDHVVTLKRAMIAKGDTKDERYVFGVVMEPDTVDTQGDTQTAAEIRKAAFQFMEAYRQGGKAGHMGIMHKELANGDFAIVESFLQKGDGAIAGHQVSDGTWLMGVRVLSDARWAAVKKGDFTGFSIGGTARRRAG